MTHSQGFPLHFTTFPQYYACMSRCYLQLGEMENFVFIFLCSRRWPLNIKTAESAIERWTLRYNFKSHTSWKSKVKAIERKAGERRKFTFSIRKLLFYNQQKNIIFVHYAIVFAPERSLINRINLNAIFLRRNYKLCWTVKKDINRGLGRVKHCRKGSSPCHVT